MLSEHNPIAELVHQIQQKWVDEVSPFPKLKLTRWLINPDEARLYEGFLRLESTEHGSIPEILVAMLTPFLSEMNYSQNLIRDWIKNYREDLKTQEKLQQKGINKIWDHQPFSAGAELRDNDFDKLLLEMLSSFKMEMIERDRKLVVALFPYSIHNMQGMRNWLSEMLRKGMPDGISFMIFDHTGENYYDKVFEKFPEITKTLHVNLNMDEAVSKIAKMGNPNSPEVKFRECILEMGKAVQKNDQARLDHWGEKALLATQQSGLKSMFASAHLVYAGMLFNFKKFEKIDPMLQKGLRIAEQGLKLNDASCKPLIIQLYGYMAASKQLQKNTLDAIKMYEKQGDIAVQYQLPTMALTPYQQAYTLSRKKMPMLHDDLLKKTFGTGISLPKEELVNSSFAMIGLDFYVWQQNHQKHNEAEETDNKLTDIFGKDWKTQAKKTMAHYSGNTKETEALN
ncbi:MAG: hypothetical protein JNM14_16500 [Ferruginibacter sp.]|nr:hypothetical protein [Ferruginibacter sp.]